MLFFRRNALSTIENLFYFTKCLLYQSFAIQHRIISLKSKQRVIQLKNKAVAFVNDQTSVSTCIVFCVKNAKTFNIHDYGFIFPGMV